MPIEITTITLKEGMNSLLIKYTNFLINRDYNWKLRKIEIKESSIDGKKTSLMKKI